jgi:hypothetical protein
MAQLRWMTAAGVVLIATLGATLGYSLAQESGPPAKVPFAGTQVDLEQARGVGRQMQVQAAVVAGYPLVGTRVEVRTRTGYEAGVPAEFDPGTTSGSNNFLYVGKLAAFDAYWVGLEAKDGSKVWIPREGVSQVYEMPAKGVAASQPARPAPEAPQRARGY